MDDEQLRALEAAARELRLRADDPEAADDVRAAAASAFVERQATEARQLVVRCREILVRGGIEPDTTVTVTVGSLTERPPIWDSARDPVLTYRGWVCDPVGLPAPGSTPRLILPATADTMIGTAEGEDQGADRETTYALLTDEELARHLGDGSLTYNLTTLLVGHDLSWTSAVPPNDRLVDRVRAWWRGVASP